MMNICHVIIKLMMSLSQGQIKPHVPDSGFLSKQVMSISQSPYLTQEHVLRVLLSLCDLLSKLLHLGVLWSVGVDLVLQLLVLVQKLLGISQTVGDVF